MKNVFPVNHFYVFSEDKIHLVYDDLYENRETRMWRRLDSLLRNALTERSMPTARLLGHLRPEYRSYLTHLRESFRLR